VTSLFLASGLVAEDSPARDVSKAAMMVRHSLTEDTCRPTIAKSRRASGPDGRAWGSWSRPVDAEAGGRAPFLRPPRLFLGNRGVIPWH